MTSSDTTTRRDELDEIRPLSHYKRLIVILTSIYFGMSIDRYLNFSRCYTQKSIELPTAPSSSSSSSSHHRGDRGRDPDYDACDPRNFLVLVMGGAREKYQERRTRWRESPCPASYAEGNVTYRFLLAMPAHETIDPNGHNQAHFASHGEISDMAKLRDEYATNGDVVLLSMMDVYDNIALKELRGMEWAADRGMTSHTSIVIKHDDEYCLRPGVLSDICRGLDGLSNSSLYAGNYLWSDAQFEQQRGLDGSFAPYFSGWLYALSSDLVRDIAHDPKSVLTSMNVAYAGDLQVGWWVKNQADRADRARRIDYVMENKLIWAIDEGVEGLNSTDSRRGRRD
ncbi:hypothetical protein ACHAXA_006205 [Cyclostephanos tholiformis]|uniref:Hexosyltransferase n=1 Tax=Cyclostephanos tholiformis TaxID=382380 RepID=A0ABD3R559_9STRA